jgi:hypothetical protein
MRSLHIVTLSIILSAPPALAQAPTKTAALTARVAALEKENGELKDKLLSCMAAQLARPAEPVVAAGDAEVKGAVAALKGVYASLHGSYMDFRQYYIVATQKVSEVPASRPETGWLKAVLDMYNDALDMANPKELGYVNGNPFNSLKWTAISSKYSTAASACAPTQYVGRTAMVNYTGCALGIANAANAELDSKLSGRVAATNTLPPTRAPSPTPVMSPTSTPWVIIIESTPAPKGH